MSYTDSEKRALQLYLTTEEYSALMSGVNPTLGLLNKADKILNKNQIDTLVDTVQDMQVRMFVIFKVLEEKGVIAYEDMARVELELLKKGDGREPTKTTSLPSSAGRASDSKAKTAPTKKSGRAVKVARVATRHSR